MHFIVYILYLSKQTVPKPGTGTAVWLWRLCFVLARFLAHLVLFPSLTQAGGSPIWVEASETRGFQTLLGSTEHLNGVESYGKQVF